MTRFQAEKVRRSLEEASQRAADLYDDSPIDYKGRSIRKQSIVNAGKDPHYLDVIQATLTYARGSKLLDIGIAYGIYAIVLKEELLFDVCGVEHPDNMNVYCRLPVQEGIDVRGCDLHQDELPFKKEQFDVVIASEVIEHLLMPPKRVFFKILPVLRPGGRLIVTTPNFASLRNVLYLARGGNPVGRFPDELNWENGVATDLRVHPREYTVKEVEEELLLAGFENVRVRTKLKRLDRGASLQAKLLNLVMCVSPNRREKIVAVGVKP
jgi:2-polyprenyl-3-methyl-5-hydroxy-6-metoxy-1,4-benzoquinol methylase